MSSGPTLIKKESFQTRVFYHLKLTPEDWCGYFKGVCGIENNIEGQYCWACKHRKPLDIPHLLAERGR